jgi:hypothetical protein
MKKQKVTWLMLFLFPITTGWSLAGSSPQTGPAGAVPVSMVVSVEAKRSGEVPTISREDVRVYQGKDRVQVTAWVPLQGDKAELELYVLIDDAADTNIALQYDDVRQFMNAQPATTAIAVGYIRFGTVEIVQKLTKDHAQAGKALRLPMGVGAGIGSPYVSVEDLIKHWPESAPRHEILMLTSGIDQLQSGPSDLYLLRAIEQAQQAGVQVHGIYASTGGHFGHSFWRVNWGQNDLSQLAEETGGESYFQNFQTPIAFSPFLEQIADRLKHQYRLTFLAKPEKKASYQRVRLETEVPNAELVGADRVFVPAAK